MQAQRWAHPLRCRQRWSLRSTYSAELGKAVAEDRQSTQAALRNGGFGPNFVPYEPGANECATTGIDVWCCPCGRHEQASGKAFRDEP